MRPSELGEWMALEVLSPSGESRADLRMAIIASTIANVNRDPKKRPKPYSAREFMPFIEQDEPKPVDQKVLAERLLAAFGLKLDPSKLKKKKGGA